MSDNATLRFAASYSATDLNKSGGKLLDAASRGAVRITRRQQRFVLICEEALVDLLEEARDDRPRSLEDLLRDYDAKKIKKLTRWEGQRVRARDIGGPRERGGDFSALRTIDYQARSVQYENHVRPEAASEANRRIRMISP